MEVGYHGVHFLGITIMVASLSMGQTTNATYAGASTQGLAYVPNSAIAIVGLLVAILGTVLDPFVERLNEDECEIRQGILVVRSFFWASCYLKAGALRTAR